jgi:formamidopyrimidine-DNA glycosylase
LQPASSLTDLEHRRLEFALHEQLLATLAMLGAGGEIVYVEERGAPNPFALYQREGERCPKCMELGREGIIATFRQAGRGTWFCPRCQGGDTSASPPSGSNSEPHRKRRPRSPNRRAG